MERLVQVLDDIDDVTGLVVSAASPWLLIAAALICIAVIVGALSAGFTGALAALLLGSLVASLVIFGLKHLR